MPNKKVWPTFYYDGASRVDLIVDERRVVLDTKRAVSCLDDLRLKELILLGEQLLYDLVLLKDILLYNDETAKLDAADALSPVFVFEKAYVVALDDVHVTASPSVHTQLLALVADLAEVVMQDGHKLVLRPKPGSGTHPLTIANLLAESKIAASVAPNFLHLSGVR